MAQKRTKRMAVVNCAGGSTRAENPGAGSPQNGCRGALEAGEKIIECGYGCLGLGDCVAACKLGAITVGPTGAAVVDREKCVGCGLCVGVCPRGLIRLSEPEFNIFTRCQSAADGPTTRKVCATGCIACGICEKNCPAGAITVTGNRAVIDEAKCIACGMCAVKCPRGTIGDDWKIFTIDRA
ncbi:4Fe-4S binding protein [Ruminococcaceae bacterium OttesenSCG-928-D13]|nr:4Fe-4S binding protein [Ruminococcaceae bacterium OttesenSCG-928-D13]